MILLFCVLSCKRIVQPPATNKAMITINTDIPSKTYNPMIFGGFLEHFGRQIYGGVFEPGSSLSNEQGFRMDVIKAMKELKLSVVRWPGGCFASGYHWKDGVGKLRKPVDDPVWGVTDTNTFGTDEFVQWCRLVGCEPYICTNAGNGTAEEMQEWVEYCNAKESKYAELRVINGNDDPFNVRIWSIGNENWGGHEIGAKTPKTWGPFVNRSAELMLDVDSNLILAAAATPDKNWTLPLLRFAGEYLDYVAIHGYWLPLWQKNEMPDYLSCIMQSKKPEENIEEVVKIITEAGYQGKIKIVFDEWNLRGWHHPGFPRKESIEPGDTQALELIKKREINSIAKQYTMADALFSASFLNACLRHSEDVDMTNIAPIVNTRGPLYVHPAGIVKRTTFHTLAMYANELEERVGYTQVTADKLTNNKDSVDIIDVIATVDKKGENWAISLINRHPSENLACTVKLGDKPLNGKYKATILTGDSPDSFNDIEHPNRVAPKELELWFKKGIAILPPHSLIIVHVRGENR